MMTSEELAYMAGIVDGEGSVAIYSRKDRSTYRGVVTVAMCEPEAIQLLHKEFGGSVSKIPAKNDRSRPQYGWCIAAIKAAVFLRSILPYMRIKTSQAKAVIALQESNNAMRKATSLQRSERCKKGLIRMKQRFETDQSLIGRQRQLYEFCADLNRRGSSRKQPMHAGPVFASKPHQDPKVRISEWHQKRYREQRDSMTPEQLAAYRAKARKRWAQKKHAATDRRQVNKSYQPSLLPS